MGYPAEQPCPKCGKLSPFNPREETPHWGEIRCPEHGHSWVSRPTEDKKPKRKENRSLIPLLHGSYQDFCWFCLRRGTLLRSLRPSITLEVHHITPVADGGTDDSHNLILLCTECHAEAHRKREAFQRYCTLLNGSTPE